MDADQFDRMVRSIGSRTRRQLMAGGLAAAFGARGGIRDVLAAKRCPKSKRCGRECCASKRCFVKQNGKPFCCKTNNVCHDPRDPSGAIDRCCYRDETCNTNIAGWEFWGPCCRDCGGSCCTDAHHMCDADTNQCRVTNTARTGRFRR